MKKTALLVALCLLLTAAFSFTVSAAEYPLQRDIEYTKYPVTPDGAITEKEWGKPLFSGDPTTAEGFYVPEKLNDSLVPKDIKVYVRWDELNLYIGAEVEYKSFWNQQKKTDIWMGDSLEIDVCVSPDNQGSRWRTNSGYSVPDARGYSYIFSEPDPDQIKYVDYIAERRSSYIGQSAVTLEGNTAVYECTFPWTAYGNNRAIGNGQMFAVNIAFFLSDGSKNALPEMGTFTGSVSVGTDTSDGLSYPRFVLKGGPKDLEDIQQAETPEDTDKGTKAPSVEVIVYTASAAVAALAVVIVVIALIISKKKK